MNADLERLTKIFGYDLTGKVCLEIFHGEMIDKEEIKQTKVGAWLAVEIDEIKDGKFGVPNRKIDFILIHGLNHEALRRNEAELWRILRSHGAIYVSLPIAFSWVFRGWKMVVFRPFDDIWAAMWMKQIPNLPVMYGKTQDQIVQMVRRTGRGTKKQPETVGANEFGQIVKWFMVDCTLYFERGARFDPYMVMDIGPKEV